MFAIRACSCCGRTDRGFSKNGRFQYSLCKHCKKIKDQARRYGITIEKCEALYAATHCSICHDRFERRLLQHIHHIGSKTLVVCYYCNKLIGQETGADAHRLISCLEFIKMPDTEPTLRKNLFNRVNPQGSLRDPSETTCQTQVSGLFECVGCRRLLPKDAFSISCGFRKRWCKKCQIVYYVMRKYKLPESMVRWLYSAELCDCCGLPFPNDDKQIHHVGNVVRGIVCNGCNSTLRNETPAQERRIQICLDYLMMI